MGKLVVDPSRGDWTWRRSEIARFLELRLVSDSLRAEGELARYVGRYRVAWNGRIRGASDVEGRASTLPPRRPATVA
jgi:hypothetical protein